MDETEQILNRLAQVEQFIDSLKASNRIPYEVDVALRERLSIGSSRFNISSKGVNSEDITIDEAGTAINDVLNDPDGWIEVVLENGLTKHVPYYDL